MGAKPKIAMPVVPEMKAPDALPPPPQESPTAKANLKAANRMTEGLSTTGTILTSRSNNALMPAQSGVKTLLGA